MFWEMAQDFQMDNLVQHQDMQWLCGQSSLYDSESVASSWWEGSTTQQQQQFDSLDTFGAHNLCR